MTILKTKPSHVFAEYVKKPERFADFVNLVLFGGEEIIKQELLYPWDTDGSTVLHEKVVMAVQRFYAWDKDIGSVADMTLSKEEAIVVSTLVRVEELIDYIEKEEKEEINMCTAIREFRAEGEKIGINRGMAKTLIKLLKKQISLSEKTEDQIERSEYKQLNLLTDSLSDIQTEEDVLKIIA